MLAGSDGSHTDGLDNFEIVKSHADVNHLLPPSDTGWLDVGIADDVRDPLLRDDVVLAEQRFLHLTNCDTVRERVSELAKDHFKSSGIMKAVLTAERASEYRPMSPSTKNAHIARSSSPTTAAATPMTMSRAGTPMQTTARGTRAFSVATPATVDTFARPRTPHVDAPPPVVDFAGETAEDPVLNRIEDLFLLRFTWLRELRYKLFWNVNAQAAMLSAIASEESTITIQRRTTGGFDDAGGVGGMEAHRGEDNPTVRYSRSDCGVDEDGTHIGKGKEKMLLFDGSFERSAGIDNRVVNIASFVIRKWRQKENYSAPDRISLLQEIYELELALNRSRTKLMESYFFVYNRTSDDAGVNTTNSLNGETTTAPPRGTQPSPFSSRSQMRQEMISVASRDPVISSESLDDSGPRISGSQGLVNSYKLLMTSFDDEYAMVVGMINLAIARECGIRNRVHLPSSSDIQDPNRSNASRTSSIALDRGKRRHGVPPPIYSQPDTTTHVTGASSSSSSSCIVNDASINDTYDSLSLVSRLPGTLRDIAKRIKNNYCNEIEKGGFGGGDGTESNNSKLLFVAIHRMVIKWALAQWVHLQRDEVSFQREECAFYDSGQSEPCQKSGLRTMLFPVLRGEDACFDCITLDRLVKSKTAFMWAPDTMVQAPNEPRTLKDCLNILYFSSFRINLANAKYESNVLSATYAAMARSVGIRVHGVVMPPLDFENKRLTPSSFQALEEDRGDFEELDVNAVLRTYLSEDARATRSRTSASSSKMVSSAGDVKADGIDSTGGNNSDFAITEWDSNLWDVSKMNSVVDIAKVLSSASAIKSHATNMAFARTVSSPAGTVSARPRRVTSVENIGLSASPATRDVVSNVDTVAVNYFSILARVELMQSLQVAAYRIAVNHNHLLILVMEKSVMRKRAALALRQWRRMRHENQSKTDRQDNMRAGDTATDANAVESAEADFAQQLPVEAYQERVKLLHFGVSRQQLLLTKSDRDLLQAKRNKAAALVGPLWFSPNKLKYKLRGTAMRSYGIIAKKYEGTDTGSGQDYRSGLIGDSTSGTHLAADVNSMRVRLTLFDEFCEKLTTELRIYSMKTELAFAVRCLNKLVVGAVNVGCTQPFFTTNNHFSYTTPDEDIVLQTRGSIGGVSTATDGGGRGSAEGSVASTLKSQTSGLENDGDAVKNVFQQRRITTKSSRHALRDASFIFNIANLDVDGGGIGEGIAQLSATKPRHQERRMSTSSHARRALSVDMMSKPSREAIKSAQKTVRASDNRETAGSSTSSSSLSTKLSSDWLFNGLLSPFEVLSSKNHLPTMKRFLESTTALVDIVYIMTAFMRLQLTASTTMASDSNVSVKQWRRSRSSFDAGQSLSKEQNFELMKHLHSLKQEVLRCNAMDESDERSVTGSAGKHLMKRRDESVEMLLLVFEDAAAKLQFTKYRDDDIVGRSRGMSASSSSAAAAFTTKSPLRDHDARGSAGSCMNDEDAFAAGYIRQICDSIAERRHRSRREDCAVVGPAIIFSRSSSAPSNPYLSQQLHATQKLYDTVDYDALCLMQISERQRRVVSECRRRHVANMRALIQETNVDVIDRVDQCMALGSYYTTASRLRIQLRAIFYAQKGARDEDTVAISRAADGIATGSYPSLLLSPATQLGVATPTIGKGTMELRHTEAEVHILKAQLDTSWIESDIHELRQHVLHFFNLRMGSSPVAPSASIDDGEACVDEDDSDDVFHGDRVTFRKDTISLLRSSLSALSGVVDSSRSIASSGGSSETTKSGTVLVSTDLLLDWIVRVVSGVHSIFDKEMSVQEHMHRTSMDKLYATMNARVLESAAAIRQCEVELESLAVTKELDVARSCTSLLIEMEDLKRMLALKDEEFAEQRMTIEQQQQEKYAEEITKLKKQVKALQYHGQLRNENVQEQMISVLHDLRKETTLRFAERAERATGEVSSLRTTMEAEEHVIQLQNELSLLRQSLLQSRTLHTMQLMSREAKYTSDIKLEQQLTRKSQRELHDTRDQYVMRNSMLAGELHSTRLALIKSQTNLSELKMTIANLEKRRDRLLKWKVEHTRKNKSSAASARGGGHDTFIADDDSMDDEPDSHIATATSSPLGLRGADGAVSSRVRRTSTSQEIAGNVNRALALSFRSSPAQGVRGSQRRPSTAPTTKPRAPSATATRHEQVYAASGVDGKARTYERMSELRHLESRLNKEKDRNAELTKKLEKALGGTHADIPESVTRKINEKLNDGLKKTFGNKASSGGLDSRLFNILLSSTDMPISASTHASLARRATSASTTSTKMKKRPTSAMPRSLS